MKSLHALHARVHKRTLPCSTTRRGVARRGAASRSVHVHCRCDRERRGAVQRSRRGAQGYHYGGSRHSLLIAGFQHESQTNERTNARSFARSPSLCFPRRARTRNAERDREKKRTEKEEKKEKKKEKTGTVFPYTCPVCACTSALRWRECVHTGVDAKRGQHRDSRVSLSLSLFFSFFIFYLHKYTSELFDVSQLIFWRKAPKHVDEKWTGLRRKREVFENFVAFHSLSNNVVISFHGKRVCLYEKKRVSR